MHSTFGDVVFHLPRSIRSAIVWAVMPAALWMSVQAPECRCATCEHRSSCPHMIFGSKNSFAYASKQRSCCRSSVRQSSGADATPIGGPGLQQASSGPCCCCQAIPNLTVTVSDRVEAPAVQRAVWISLNQAVDQAPLNLALADGRLLPPSGRLPTTDRVILLCRLLT